ncbi:MAG: lytic murein transglycosylase B [Steroidobacteraceae bacterium]
MPKRLFSILMLALLPALSLGADARPRQVFDVTRDDIREFAQGVADRNGMESATIITLLGKAKPQNSILEAMDKPAERSLAWYEYRERFLTDQRIEAGLRFWREHRTELTRVSNERGVPPEYLVAILGIETQYGRTTGRYRVLDALATLAFDYPARSAYFRQELEQFLLMARDKEIDPLTTTGSYAGAMGAPQFMPSSFRKFAVDENGKGHRDLWKDWSDVFGSVANYFVVHGWQPGGPVLVDSVGINPVDDPAAFRFDRKDTVGAIRERGYRFESTLAPDAPAWLVPAEQADGPAFRVGFNNFYVISRYNRSSRYAMAVSDLASALRSRAGEVAAASP